MATPVLLLRRRPGEEHLAAGAVGRGRLCARAPELWMCPVGFLQHGAASAGLRTGAHEVHVRDRLLFHRPDGDVQLHVSTSARPRPACVCACVRMCAMNYFGDVLF